MKNSILITAAIFACCIPNTANCFSQGTAINNNGASADNSAILDVSSTSKGQLIPRMTTSERNAIVSPAQSLLIYNLTTKCMEAYENNLWQTVWCACATPSSAGVVSGTSSVCQGQNQVSFSVSPVSNASGYNWTLSPGAAISSGANTNSITVNFSPSASSGNISVYGTTTSCGNGVPSPDFAVTVTPPPSSPVATSNSPVCTGGTLNLFASAITNASYSWTGPNGFSSSLQNPVISNAASSASGIYYVIATVNGCSSPSGSVTVNVLGIPHSSQAFTYNGDLQYFIVPACVDSVTVKMWGAGGGGFSSDKGGGGGFAQAKVDVNPGDSIKIYVGGGGNGCCLGQCSCGSLEAFPGGKGGFQGNGGGGYSGFFKGNDPVIIAGAGGGGGGGSTSSTGGAGGGLTGQDAADAVYGGKGGTQNAGGNAGSSTVPPFPNNGSYLNGGSGYYGGGGGGGYYGGGGGGRADFWVHRGAGGGSSFVSSSGTSNSQIIGGNNESAANTADADYPGGGIAAGGTAGNGGNGYILIKW